MSSFEDPSRVYASKRDTWLVVVLLLSTAGMVWAGVAVWISMESLVFRASYALIMLGSAALVGSLVYATNYRLTSEDLLIRSGPFRWRVPIESIEEVVPSRSVLSGPSLSLDRLQVKYRKSTWGVLISPEEKDDFLRDLASKAPALILKGDRLVPSG